MLFKSCFDFIILFYQVILLENQVQCSITGRKCPVPCASVGKDFLIPLPENSEIVTLYDLKL